jgi:ferredoxin
MKKNVVINSGECIGCGSCVDICSEVFDYNESETRAIVKKQGVRPEECIEEAMESCPSQCISWSTDKCVFCESCLVLCSNEEMAEVVLKEGDIKDCVEEAIGSCHEECLKRSNK